MRFGCHDAENESMLNKGYPNENNAKKNLFWVVVGGAYTYILAITYLMYVLDFYRFCILYKAWNYGNFRKFVIALLSVAELKWFALRYLTSTAFCNVSVGTVGDEILPSYVGMIFFTSKVGYILVPRRE